MGMPNGADCPRLFVSYSHLDTSYQEEFKRHLEGRASGRSIEWWADNLPQVQRRFERWLQS